MRDTVAFYNAAIKRLPRDARFPAQRLAGARRTRPRCACCRSPGSRPTTRRRCRTLHASAAAAALPCTRVARRAEAAPRANAAADEANPPFAGGRYEVALLEGTVRVAGNDFRGARRRGCSGSPTTSRRIAGVSAPTWSRARSTCARRSSCRAATPSATRSPWSRASWCAWCATARGARMSQILSATGWARCELRGSLLRAWRSPWWRGAARGGSHWYLREGAARRALDHDAARAGSALAPGRRAPRARQPAANRRTSSARWSTAACCRASAASTWSSW